MSTRTINVTHEYCGHSDYWSGNGARWGDNAGCLFAFYDHETTLREVIDQWVDDFNGGGDCDSFPEDITSEDIRKAIMDSLTTEGVKDYETNAIFGPARDLEDPIGECDESPIAVILVELE